MLENVKLRLNEDFCFQERKNNDLIFLIGKTKLTTFKAHDEILADVLYLISTQANTEEDIHDYLQRLQDDQLKTRALTFIEHLKTHQFIDYVLEWGVENQWIIRLKNGLLKWKDPPLIPKCEWELSRFSYMHRHENKWILSNPLAHFDILFEGQKSVEWFTAITADEAPCSLLKDTSSIRDYCVKVLFSSHFLHPKDEQEADYLVSWEFHDLLFHHQSRLGRSSDKYHFGATYRFGQAAHSSTIKIQTRDQILLNKPVEKQQESPPYTLFQTLEQRRSIRMHGSRFITLKELSEFLYRSVGIRQVVSDDQSQDLIFKPYPSAGAIHELEFYIVCHLAHDLKKGIYLYNGLQHSLHPISQDETQVDELIKIAASAWGQSGDSLQILIILTSQFNKMAWKYEGMAYRSTLINVGAAFQTMYLVATAMNLAPCALGYGNPHLFASITGSQALKEGSVGEFAIGTKDD